MALSGFSAVLASLLPERSESGTTRTVQAEERGQRERGQPFFLLLLWRNTSSSCNGKSRASPVSSGNPLHPPSLHPTTMSTSNGDTLKSMAPPAADTEFTMNSGDDTPPRALQKPVATSSQPPAIITVQPLRRAEMQPSYAQVSTADYRESL